MTDTEMVKALPIIDDMNEVEMVKTTRFFERKGYLPISIKFRSANCELGSTEIVEEFMIPQEIAKIFGNRPVQTKKVTMVDNYGKNFNLETRNPRALEETRDWYLNIYPSENGWDNRVEEFVVKVKRREHKDFLLKFIRGESLTDRVTQSLKLEFIKEPGLKWKKEKAYSEEVLKQIARGLFTDQCMLNYGNQCTRRPKCA